MALILCGSQRTINLRLDCQRMVLWGDGGTFRKWGLGEGKQVTGGGSLVGIFGSLSHSLLPGYHVVEMFPLPQASHHDALCGHRPQKHSGYKEPWAATSHPRSQNNLSSCKSIFSGVLS